jgi:5-methylcytosine-specific restriction endonuclease McrA
LYNYKRSAGKRGYCFELSANDFKSIVEQPCRYCGSHRKTKAASAIGTFGEYFYTGIDRINNKEGYTIANSYPCCKQCNIAKGVLSENDFYEWVKTIHNHLFNNTIK